MSENALNNHLFLGGSVDGKRLPVEQGARRHQIESVANDNAEPAAIGKGVNDPRPQRVPVVETYEAITVSHGGNDDIVYVLNALTPEGTRHQVMKHFGSDATFEEGAME